MQTLDRIRPGTVQIVPSRSPAGECQFSVLVKRSYRIASGKTAQRLERDAALRLTDAYYDHGDPAWSVLEHENEMAPFKAATDVVIVGSAYAPEGRPVAQMVAGVRVGAHKKLLQLSGDRVCHWRDGAEPAFSDPLPFTEMPIRYDRAYGGRDEKSDPGLPFFYPRNDMGRGVVLRNVKDVVQGLALPNIEDPQDLLSSERVVIGDPLRWPQQPLPQGFGWRQRTWYPRSALLGALPAFLQPGTITAEERMQLLPANHVALARQMRLPPFERQFHNGASLGLVLPDVSADESIGLRGLTPQGVFDFRLPGETPQIALDIGQGEQPLETALLTVSIRPDEAALDLIWSGLLHFGPASKLSKLTRLRATVQ
ncbi:MAG: DUF2169 domain-containing protein [Pseudomonadota bacterium]|nr:DUF2169 domain-containing protein [Pseudomonadota bacterium]